MILLSSTAFSKGKIKVFILAGQSNAQGHGDLDPVATAGTLEHFYPNRPSGDCDYIKDGNGHWATRSDVWMRYDTESDVLLTGDLKVGYGGWAQQIGPEYGMGHALGEHFDDQVLIIKTCWGGKSLAVDFRPPSAGGTTGTYYTKMITDIKSSISNIATEFPEYSGETVELAGFIWFQGWNDGEKDSYKDEYESNLLNLIKDVTSDLDVPDLPILVGLTGNGGRDTTTSDGWVKGLQTKIVPAQISAVQSTPHTNIDYAETRDFWIEPSKSPGSGLHHWNNNAESYLRIGDQFVNKITELQEEETVVSDLEEGTSWGFNYLPRVWVEDQHLGAGYSFYAAVFPMLEQYPGSRGFQSGLMSTWLNPYRDPGEEFVYNAIEGGLGWWGDTRFGTDIPKFIMGGVANGFSQWANGVGAGSSAMIAGGRRDWSVPGGKYGVAQLSNNLIWAPDGLTLQQDAKGEFLGYGYRPLPITDPMSTTYGVNMTTGNQCWTLFLNATNYKGPVAFFIPTFWTETTLDDPSLEGKFLDQRLSDKNQGFAVEYDSSPAKIGFNNSDKYARMLPLRYPATSQDRAELAREIKIYTKPSYWSAVENWFDGGDVPPTEFQPGDIEHIKFDVGGACDAKIKSTSGTSVEAEIDMGSFANKYHTGDQWAAGFNFDTTIVKQVDGMFELPGYYKLDLNNKWQPIDESQVPAATGLTTNGPTITPRPEISYLTPLETDCAFQDSSSPWNSPGPVAGPFYAKLGDGSRLKYYWYKFIDQPAIIHANLPDSMRQNMQARVEKIHTSWLSTDNYMPELSSGKLVGIDAGQIVTPPAGMEIGYVAVVSRQELDDGTKN